MRGKIKSAVGLLAVLALAIGASVAPASAAVSVHPRAFAEGTLCDSMFGTCMNGYDGSEGVVKTFDRDPDDGQLMAVVSTSECGSGTVSESCPFTEGSGLNSFYSGAAIVRLQNFTNKMFYRWDNSGQVLEDASGTGELWVQFDQFANAGGLLINVAASDNHFTDGGLPDVAAFADSTGNGHPLAIVYAAESKNPSGSDAWINEGT